MTMLMPPPVSTTETVTVHVPDHAGALVEMQAPAPTAHAPLEPKNTFVDYLPWMLLVGMAALMLGLLAGMMIGPRVTYTPTTGWAPASYGLEHEHIAQAPGSSAATSLAKEHLAQAPVSSAATSLAQEHQNLAP